MKIKKTALIASCLPLLFLSACDKPKTEETPAAEQKAAEMHHVEVSKEAVGTEAEPASTPEQADAQMQEQQPAEAAEEGAPVPEEQVDLPDENADQEDMEPAAEDQNNDELVNAAEQAPEDNTQQAQEAPPAPEQAEPAAEEKTEN